MCSASTPPGFGSANNGDIIRIARWLAFMKLFQKPRQCQRFGNRAIGYLNPQQIQRLKLPA